MLRGDITFQTDTMLETRLGTHIDTSLDTLLDTRFDTGRDQMLDTKIETRLSTRFDGQSSTLRVAPNVEPEVNPGDHSGTTDHSGRTDYTARTDHSARTDYSGPEICSSPEAQLTLMGADQLDTQGFDLPCQVATEDFWFAERPELLDQAKTLCGQCPLQQQCLAGALERQEPWGVWGGEILSEGRIVAVKRGRGRPRKAA